MRTNLKSFRVKHGNLSQQEMADKIGCCRTTYAAVENGTREGKDKFWSLLQKTFEVPDAEMWSLKQVDD